MKKHSSYQANMKTNLGTAALDAHAI